MRFYSKFQISKFDLFYLFNLTLTSGGKNAVVYGHKPPINHVSHDVHVIFTYGQLRWPDFDLDPYLRLASLLDAFRVI